MRARRLLEGEEDPKWEIKFKIGKEWEQASAEFQEKQDFDQFKMIVMPPVRKFLERMKTFLENKKEEYRTLRVIVGNLNKSKDALEWNHYWEDFFEWADDNNVWIEAPREDIEE